MKRGFLIVGLVVVSTAFAVQAGFAQSPTPAVKLIGCLQGDGSDEKPWMLSGVAVPAPPAPAPAGGGAGAGGRGGRGGGGAAAAPTPPPVPLVDLRLTGGMNMSIWRGMRIEVEGTLGAQTTTGLREFRATFARSVQGVCTPK
jgi:hypothetical protein